MTVKELINTLEKELTEEEKNLPACFCDSQWGAFDSEIKGYSIQSTKCGQNIIKIVVLDD